MLLDILGATGSIISGSSVLPPLLEMDFEPNDLNIYILERSEIFILTFIQFNCGYNLDCSQGSSYGTNTHILRVHWLEREGRIINIIVVARTNTAVAVFHFHLTIVMNFITGYGVYCAYADLTLSKLSVANNNLLVAPSARQQTRRCIDKYIRHGIRYMVHLQGHEGWENHVCSTDKSCPATIRSLHNNGGLLIPFPSRTPSMDDGIRTELVYNGSQSVVWSLGGPSCSNRGVYHDTFVSSVPILCARLD
ncbi:hypothetical protein B0H13DRAFT_2351844 [Mycena leptocephala]|nr:hypothetical protein B0H13DRAFT_2351844 [Mycena leptocephala]